MQGSNRGLPWGADYPDPSILLLPDPFNLPSGFTEQNPEPATLSLIAVPLCAGLWFRRRQAKARINV